MEAKVLATVGTKTITEADVDAFIMQLGQRGQAYQNPQGRAMVLEQLISKALLVLDATRNLYERDAEFKAELARVKEDLLANYAVEKAIRDVRVNDADVEAYYNENKAQFVQGATVNASHILVDSEEKAVEILAKINAGEMTFEDAAKEFSTQFGYHLIRLNSKGEETEMPFDAVKAQLKEKLMQDKQQAAYQSKLNQLKILYPVDRASL